MNGCKVWVQIGEHGGVPSPSQPSRHPMHSFAPELAGIAAPSNVLRTLVAKALAKWAVQFSIGPTPVEKAWT